MLEKVKQDPKAIKSLDEANTPNHTQERYEIIKTGNIIFTDSEINRMDSHRIWLLVGAFSQIKKVTIFTDDPDEYNASFCYQPPLNISIKPAFDSIFFDVQNSLSMWSTFQNTELVSQFEVG